MGGEEFLLMLPNTPVDEAVKVVERLQRALTKKFFMNNNDRILITFSAGVALRGPDESQDAVIARADGAMYEAKQTGKNRVCIAK
jgi:diguanylate cyclase